MIGAVHTLFFSPHGRAGRVEYIVVQAVVLAADAALRLYIKLNMGALAANALKQGSFNWLDLFQYMGRGLLYISFVISLKRLRDMGQSKWWLALIYGPGIIMTAFISFSAELLRSAEHGFAYAVVERIATGALWLFNIVDPSNPMTMLGIYVIMYGFKFWLATSPSVYASPSAGSHFDPTPDLKERNAPPLASAGAPTPAAGQASRASVHPSFGRRAAPPHPAARAGANALRPPSMR